MLTLKTLRLLDKMPTLYRDAVDRRCRVASGYGGERPSCDALVAWRGEAAEAERLTRRLAALDGTPAAERTASIERRRARVTAWLTASGQRRDYHDAYAAVAGTILEHIDPKLIPLMEGLPQDFQAAGRRRANDYRFLLLQDQLDSAPLEIDDDGVARLAGIDELFALAGTRRHVRRLRRDASMAALHLGCLLGQVGKAGADDYQLYAPDVLVSVSREQNRADPGMGQRAPSGRAAARRGAALAAVDGGAAKPVGGTARDLVESHQGGRAARRAGGSGLPVRDLHPAAGISCQRAPNFPRLWALKIPSLAADMAPVVSHIGVRFAVLLVVVRAVSAERLD